MAEKIRSLAILGKNIGARSLGENLMGDRIFGSITRVILTIGAIALYWKTLMGDRF